MDSGNYAWDEVLQKYVRKGDNTHKMWKKWLKWRDTAVGRQIPRCYATESFISHPSSQSSSLRMMTKMKNVNKICLHYTGHTREREYHVATAQDLRTPPTPFQSDSPSHGPLHPLLMTSPCHRPHVPQLPLDSSPAATVSEWSSRGKGYGRFDSC